MNYKKLFFPIGGGDELEERLHGAFLIAKYFDTYLEVLQSNLKSNVKFTDSLSLPKEIQISIDEVLENQYHDKNKEFISFFNNIANEAELSIEKNTKAYAKLNIKEGLRSTLVEQDSKFCDLVIAAAPPSGISTATFESVVLKSGKPVLMFPRVMKKFSTESVIIGWNNSPEVARALTSSIEILKQAKKVKIISSSEYTKDTKRLDEMLEYLKLHGINATYEIVQTTRIPGEALLDAAINGDFDLIVAGAYSNRGLKELMFGGTTRYLLEHSTLPIFLSH